ncbi:bifunctional transcriptional activator/DNA repair enzyme AdaA [uncultured Kordia sp.]|uniref:bifunctional transcriptional activator/DNA repair enzyme AdaA n=1 Tax=uncultured Kordia sp. TaxID=507699 RepID=UPI0026161ABC|nr:methylated-DNA--[protein]-cysteine S-methyltransferase [uncultured Kordia sp.]
MLITDNNKIETYYQALLDRKQSFVGIFFVGVKTTSIFCIATCRARKPKRKNVEFYTSFKTALANGYRPCKICKPTENTNQAPEIVEKAIQMVKEHPTDKITDFQLRQKGISPEVVRRWFKKNYGMTFQAYQRMYRINNAFQELKQGKNATHTAFDSSYESLSGFNYTFKKLIGESPKHSKNKNIILINRLTTPLGPMFVCATDNGICLLEFVDRRMLEKEFKDLQKLLNATIILGENLHIKQAKKEVKEYFEGTRKVFDLQLETPGTEFQNSVWNYLKDIEYAKTVTYQQQAEKIGNPKAVRAVASANGCNRIAIVIPCHRVLGKDGKMTGYSGGIERKKWLIEHERKNSKS